MTPRERDAANFALLLCLIALTTITVVGIIMEALS